MNDGKLNPTKLASLNGTSDLTHKFHQDYKTQTINMHSPKYLNQIDFKEMFKNKELGASNKIPKINC